MLYITNHKINDNKMKNLQPQMIARDTNTSKVIVFRRSTFVGYMYTPMQFQLLYIQYRVQWLQLIKYVC